MSFVVLLPSYPEKDSWAFAWTAQLSMQSVLTQRLLLGVRDAQPLRRSGSCTIGGGTITVSSPSPFIHCGGSVSGCCSWPPSRNLSSLILKAVKGGEWLSLISCCSSYSFLKKCFLLSLLLGNRSLTQEWKDSCSSSFEELMLDN